MDAGLPTPSQRAPPTPPPAPLRTPAQSQSPEDDLQGRVAPWRALCVAEGPGPGLPRPEGCLPHTAGPAALTNAFGVGGEPCAAAAAPGPFWKRTLRALRAVNTQEDIIYNSGGNSVNVRQQGVITDAQTHPPHTAEHPPPPPVGAGTSHGHLWGSVPPSTRHGPKQQTCSSHGSGGWQWRPRWSAGSAPSKPRSSACRRRSLPASSRALPLCMSVS